MKILVVVPRAATERTGNRATASRYVAILERLGHDVHGAQEFSGEDVEVLVALHATKSHASIDRFARAHPTRPIVVVLTGTDLYGAEHELPEFEHALELSARLLVLQPAALAALPFRVHGKTRVIVQSAAVPSAYHSEPHAGFVALLVGNLRAVKDPFLAAEAAALVFAESRLRVVHVGAVLEAEFEDAARRAMSESPRYEWLGELPSKDIDRWYARSDVFVLTSRSEGGSLALIEAIVRGVACLATRVAGNVGLLGDDHAGLFERGDSAQLARLLMACERDREFREKLEAQSRALAARFAPALEAEAWSALLAEFVSPS